MMYSYSKLIACLTFLMLGSNALTSQAWIDKRYDITTENDILYGTTEDFAGEATELLMDISTPINDTVDPCGRPLMIFVHGGAWIAGSKSGWEISRMREEFAQRGFTTASISYRLGWFHTNDFVHCNLTNLGLEWDCLNAVDSSEWYRAYYRGIQDLNGAIRYLVNRSDSYDLDPNNIFLVGISAGSFNVMGAGFIDSEDEVLTDMSSQMPDAPAPNINYEVPCITNPKYNLASSIASMRLTRPDLGSYAGMTNFPLSIPYTVRGVGAFFGGVFNNIFKTSNDHSPALYMFHQPNDLIVPFTEGKLLQGFSNCASNFGGCQSIINRNRIKGSANIAQMLDKMEANGEEIPEYLFDRTNNNADCLLQIATPSLSGHAIDNFALRTKNMATFFADKIEICDNTTSVQNENSLEIAVYPTLISRNSFIHAHSPYMGTGHWTLIRGDGRIVKLNHTITFTSRTETVDLSSMSLTSGVHFFQLKIHDQIFTQKIIIVD